MVAKDNRHKSEVCYDAVPYIDKESAGLPYRYYNLSTEQKFFVDSMFDSCYNIITSREEVREEVENIRSLVEEIQKSTEIVYNTFEDTNAR